MTIESANSKNRFNFLEGKGELFSIYFQTRFEEEAEAVDFKGNYFEFIPFGSGRRSCPGMQMGLYTMELAVAQMLHCFTWSFPEGKKPSEIDMSELFGLTVPLAGRLLVVPTARLLCPLF